MNRFEEPENEALLNALEIPHASSLESGKGHIIRSIQIGNRCIWDEARFSDPSVPFMNFIPQEEEEGEKEKD